MKIIPPITNLNVVYFSRLTGVLLAFALLTLFMPARQVGNTQAQSTLRPRVYLPVVININLQNGPETYTTSYYMATVDPAELYRRGCELGKRDLGLPGGQDNVVILDFGGPRDLGNGVYGSRLFITAARVSTSQIAAAVENFGVGYYVCTDTDNASTLIIGVGTNNYTYDGTPVYAVTAEHGRAWAAMVNDINTWFTTNGYAGQVGAVGANDIELGWNTYTATKAWLDGYDSVNQYEMINFGAIPGCPYFASPGAQCGSSGYIWNKDEVWYVTWGSPPVYSLPEIYANSGVNAQQWYLMSLYSYQYHGLAMEFRGVMTQYKSCQVRPDSACPVLDNTPLEGFNQLNNLVNGDSRTGHWIRWSTDITW
jgi:hypothetical protein